MAGALAAAGLVGHEIVSPVWIWVARDLERRGRTWESSASAAFTDRKIGCVGLDLCTRVPAPREIRASRVVADRAIPEVYTDRDSRSPRSSSREDESSLLLVSREDLSGAVESNEFLVRAGEIEDGVVVQSAEHRSALSELVRNSGERFVSGSWMGTPKKKFWWSHAGTGRLCMVEQIVSRLQSAAAGPGSNLSSLLAPFAGKVSLRVATLVFRTLPQAIQPLEFYSWLKKHQRELDVSLPLYDALVQCLLRDRHWASVDCVVEEMCKGECFPGSGLYRKMIKAACDAGSPKVANQWLQRMLASGLVAQLPIWNSVLCAFARDGSFEEVVSLYEKLKAHGLDASMITYCALLSACRNAKKVQEAQGILTEMKSRGMQPNRIVYSVLVDLYGKAGMPDSAAGAFREMEKAGYEPDQVAYNTLIHAFLKSGMINEASKAFERAIEPDGHVDPVIFSTMINMYSNLGLVERARDVLQIMGRYDYEKKHYQYAYTILINAYVRVGQLRAAITLFDQMQAAGHPMGDRILTTMLNVYFKVGRLRCAEEMFQEMIGTGKCRNVVAYGTMINIYGRMGRMEDAVRIFYSLKASGSRGNTVIYNTLIYCHGKMGNLNAVEEYVKEMKTAGLKMDRVTYSSLIKAYNKSGKPCDAIRTYDEMRSAGVSLDKLVVGTMVNTFGRLKRYEELVQLLDETRHERVRPDERLLRSIIDVYDTTQLEDCPPDTFSRFGELLIAMELAVNRHDRGGGRFSCTENQDRSPLAYRR